jgi:type IV pilus assembly protein PilM
LAAAPPQAAKESPNFTPLPAAIDFGSSSVKLLQLGREPKGDVQVIVLDEEPYEKVPAKDVYYQQKDALQKVLSRNSVGGSAVISLSTKEVQVYNFVFPVMSEKELEEAISWKIKQTRPFDLDLEKVKYGFIKWMTRTASATVSTQQRVTVVCAPAETVSKKADLLGQMGLKTLGVEVAPVSMVNLKKYKPALFANEETTLWLDLGAEESTLAVEKGGAILFFRNLAITARQLTRQLSQFGRIDEPKAEELKRRHGLSYWDKEKEASGVLEQEKGQKREDESAAVFYGIVSSLENLVVDIEHSFKYFSYQVTQSQVNKYDRVLITGGGAELKNLDHFLSARLGVPVERLNPIGGLKVTERLLSEKSSLLEAPSRFAVSLGLALGQALPKPMRMNLLLIQKSISFKSILAQIKKDPKRSAAAAACVLLILLGPQFARTIHYQMKLNHLDKTVKTAKAQLTQLQKTQLMTAEEETKLMDKRKILELKIGVLRESSRGEKQFSETLSKLSELLPEEVWITKLAYNEKKMTLVGLTLKNELIMSFMEELNKSENFKDVTFNYTQKENNAKTYRFEVMMNVR